MREHKFTAWAIDARSEEGHGLIGRYWWFDKPPQIPSHLEGCEVALFKTRKIARENLPNVKRVFPDAVIVKVKVTIQRVNQHHTATGPFFQTKEEGEE